MSLVALLKKKGPSGFGYGSTAEEVTRGLDLSGRTYVVTGSTSGLGLETVRVLGLRGAHVIATARTEARAREALESVSVAGTGVACELSEPSSVRACVERIAASGRQLDGIVCNAGVMALPRLQTRHGVELQLLTNHVGHFILVTGLLERLGPAGRVVMLSSAAHAMAPRQGVDLGNLDGRKAYSAWRAYGQAKLANLLFAKELSRKLAGSGRTANAVHPGVIRTHLGRHMSAVNRVGLALGGPLFLKSIPQGAATQCYVATHPAVAGTSGAYFADCNVAKPSPRAEDPKLAEALWEATERLVAQLP